MVNTDDSTLNSVNATRNRKRVEAVTNATLKRAKNGSAFTRCDSCNKDVAVALISMHDCSLEAKIKMNLETLAVDPPTESVAKKPSERKKAVKGKEPSVKKAKKEKDSSKPKKPPTAFFLFMDDFRKSFKEANPDNKKVSVVAKEGGEKWKSMSAEEKKPYADKAAELKEKYQKVLENPNETETETETDKADEDTIEVDDDVEEVAEAE